METRKNYKEEMDKYQWYMGMSNWFQYSNYNLMRAEGYTYKTQQIEVNLAREIEALDSSLLF